MNVAGAWHRDCATGAKCVDGHHRGSRCRTSVPPEACGPSRWQASGQATVNIAVRIAAGQAHAPRPRRCRRARGKTAGAAALPPTRPAAVSLETQAAAARSRPQGLRGPGAGQPGTNGCAGTAGFNATGDCDYGYADEGLSGFLSQDYVYEGTYDEIVNGGAAGSGVAAADVAGWRRRREHRAVRRRGRVGQRRRKHPGGEQRRRRLPRRCGTRGHRRRSRGVGDVHVRDGRLRPGR